MEWAPATSAGVGAEAERLRIKSPRAGGPSGAGLRGCVKGCAPLEILKQAGRNPGDDRVLPGAVSVLPGAVGVPTNSRLSL